MKQLIFFLFFLLVSSCVSDSNQNGQSNVCDNCQIEAVDVVTQNWQNLTEKEIESFLCVFNKSCDLTKNHEIEGATYYDIACENLIISFAIHTDKFLKVLRKNESISKKGILKAIQKGGGDLPYSEIFVKLTKIDERTEFEEDLLKALSDKLN